VNTVAMVTLGSWALVNIGTGTILTFTTEGVFRAYPGDSRGIAGKFSGL